jgi:hypothetical protein
MHQVQKLIATSFPILFCLYTSNAVAAEYYTVKESSAVSLQSPESFDPFVTMEEVAQVVADPILSLMEWQIHAQPLEIPTAPYNRVAQYGTWVRGKDENNCYNTRARTLIRQSEVPVQFNQRGCTVISGKWTDPYSGQHYTEAADMDIDHMVPLKNSYTSGAWKWDNKRRCLYANFMKNDFHLFAIQGDENKVKGDSSPEKFMPPDPNYKCEYLANWLKIKLIWGLALGESEGQAIATLTQQNHCDRQAMNLKWSDLQSQRQIITANLDYCGK